MGGIADAVYLASSSTFGARGFSCGVLLCSSPVFISPMKPLREPARMRALRFGGSDLGHWSVENAGDVETVVWRMLLERCFVLRRSCCGSAVDGAIGGGIVSACAAGLSFWIAPVTAADVF